ncbi:MAG: hypothetical protein V2I36_07795 [Desulfopila sp.]|jgi:hypothetical protein|nr:hypothetical protein [Desulfopila sp.]
MKRILMLLCAVNIFLMTTLSFAADNKVVVIPLNSSSKISLGNWNIVSVNSLGAVTRESTYETTQITSGACGYIARTAGFGESDGYLVAPIQLPDKATITSFSGLMCDNSDSTSISMQLFRSDGETLAIVGTQSLVSSTNAYKRIDNIINVPVVDNSNYSYWVYMSISGSDRFNAYPISAHVTVE